MNCRYPFVIQHDERDCGAACLSMVAECYGKKLKLETCRNLIKVGPEGASIYGMIQGADKIGINAEAYESDIHELISEIKAGNVHFPLVVRVLEEEIFEHFIVVYKMNKKRVIIGDPGKSKIHRISLIEFENMWMGQLITFERREDCICENEREFNFLKYFKEIKSQKKFMILALIGALIVLFINLAGAYLFRFILSDSYNTFYICGHIITNGIEKLCLTLAILYIFRMVVEIFRCNILTVLTKSIDVSITMGYYKHLVKIKTESFDNRQTGDFISRFYDTGDIREAVSSVVLSAIMDTGMAIICGAFLVHLNFRMFIISVVTVSLYAIVVLCYKNRIKKSKNDIMATEAKVTSLLKESVDGIQTIKAYNLEKRNIEKLYWLYDRFTDKMLIGTRIANKQNVVAAFIASIGIVIVLGIGYKEYLKGNLSMSDIFTFYYILEYFMGPISGLIKLQPDIEMAVTAADRLADVLDIDEEQIENDDNTREIINGDIVFDNITFRYGYDDPVLEHFNMEIRQGSKVAIVGGSGSGKTTIAKLILGFYYPEEGAIYIGEKNIKDCSVNILRNSVAYISQDAFLFEDSFYNNLTLGNPDADVDEVEKVVDDCGLRDLVNQLPYQYDTYILEGGKNLSGGERQRIAIARALISKKKIIIFDEATSNLDEDLENKINETIMKLPSDKTCIIITHRKAITNICDKVYTV